MLRRIILTLVTFWAALFTAAAQEVAWSVDMSTVLNNREGGDELTPDQTILFTRLAPEVGVSVDAGGTHTIKGGVAWYQPLTDDCRGYKVVPTIYYKWENGPWTAAVGMVPRSLMQRATPRIMWSDSLNYVTPNLRGALVRHNGSRGHIQVALDWRQMQSTTRREAFNVVVDAHRDLVGPLSLDAWVQYNHLAKVSVETVPEQCVNDDVTLLPMLSLDLARYTRLDALSLSAGAALLMSRARDDDKWRNPARFVARARAQWRWLELTEEFSTGRDAFPLYGRYGTELNLGDPYNCYKTHSRTDLRAHIVSNRCVDLSAELTFHATNRVTALWQQVSCRFYIDNNVWRHRRDKQYMRDAHLNPIF